MNTLKPLTLMQLKDKLDLSFSKSTKQIIFKVVFNLIKFIAITAIIFFAFYFLSVLRLTSLNAGIPTNFFSIIFSIVVLLSVIMGTYGLCKTLYLSKDNQVLLTMPTSRTTLFFSKIIVYAIYELIRNVFYILPILVAYGMINSMPIYFYLWAIISTVIITLFTISVSALLSIPFLYILQFIKKSKVLEYILVSVVILAVFIGIISLINNIPQNIDILGNWSTIFWELQDIFEAFVTNCYPLYCFTMAFVGYRYGISNVMFSKTQVLSLLVVLGVIISVLAITYFLIKPLFFQMASSPFEYTKKTNQSAEKNTKNSAFIGSVKKEFLVTYRTSERFNPLVMLSVILPLAIFLLNKIFGAMDTRLTGDFMGKAFNILFILLVALSTNAMVSKIYSEEGASGFVNKIVPATYVKVLISKLFIFMLFMSISILTSTIIFSSFAKISVFNTILLFLTLELVYLGHMFWSASLDIMNPQIEQYRTTGTHTNNPNETKSTLFAFIMSALIALIFYFLVSENSVVVWTKLLIIGIVYFAWNIYMYFSKIKVYFKEK